MISFLEALKHRESPQKPSLKFNFEMHTDNDDRLRRWPPWGDVASSSEDSDDDRNVINLDCLCDSNNNKCYL